MVLGKYQSVWFHLLLRMFDHLMLANNKSNFTVSFAYERKKRAYSFYKKIVKSIINRKKKNISCNIFNMKNSTS